MAVSAMKCTPQKTMVPASACGGDPGERQRVADMVGDVLDLRALVVVGEDHGVALAGEAAYLCGPAGGSGVLLEPRRWWLASRFLVVLGFRLVSENSDFM